MRIRIHVIKVYEIETDGGDTTDFDSIESHVNQVENMQSTEIEATGKLVHISTDYAIPVDCDRVLDDYDKAWWSKRDG